MLRATNPSKQVQSEGGNSGKETLQASKVFFLTCRARSVVKRWDFSSFALRTIHQSGVFWHKRWDRIRGCTHMDRREQPRLDEIVQQPKQCHNSHRRDNSPLPPNSYEFRKPSLCNGVCAP